MPSSIQNLPASAAQSADQNTRAKSPARRLVARAAALLNLNRRQSSPPPPTFTATPPAATEETPRSVGLLRTKGFNNRKLSAQAALAAIAPSSQEDVSHYPTQPNISIPLPPKKTEILNVDDIHWGPPTNSPNTTTYIQHAPKISVDFRQNTPEAVQNAKNMLAELIQPSIEKMFLYLPDIVYKTTTHEEIAKNLRNMAMDIQNLSDKSEYHFLRLEVVALAPKTLEENLNFFNNFSHEILAKTHQAMQTMARHRPGHNLELNPIYQGLKLLHDLICDTGIAIKHAQQTSQFDIQPYIQHRQAQHVLLKVNMIGFADVPAHQAAKTSINWGDSEHVNTVTQDLTQIKDAAQQLLSDSHNALRNYAEKPGNMYTTAQAIQVQHLATAFAHIKSLLVQSPLQYYMHSNDSLFHIKLNPEEFNEPGAILAMAKLFDHAYKSLRDCIGEMPMRGNVPDEINALLGDINRAIGDVGSNFNNLGRKTPDELKKYIATREEKTLALKHRTTAPFFKSL